MAEIENDDSFVWIEGEFICDSCKNLSYLDQGKVVTIKGKKLRLCPDCYDKQERL